MQVRFGRHGGDDTGEVACATAKAGWLWGLFTPSPHLRGGGGVGDIVGVEKRVKQACEGDA